MIISFCSQCGGSVSLRLQQGDHLERYICDSCDFVHYQNPKVVAGCIVHHQGAVLLCKRAIEPRLGLWTLPAGFMENGETTRQAAQREVFEETAATVSAGQLFAMTSSRTSGFVNVFYLAELAGQNYQATAESSEVRLFREQDVPDDELAFHTVRLVLQRFFSDVHKGGFGVHELEF